MDVHAINKELSWYHCPCR